MSDTPLILPTAPIYSRPLYLDGDIAADVQNPETPSASYYLVDADVDPPGYEEAQMVMVLPVPLVVAEQLKRIMVVVGTPAQHADILEGNTQPDDWGFTAGEAYAVLAANGAIHLWAAVSAAIARSA